MNKKVISKIIAGLLVAVMLCSVFGGVLSAEIGALQKTGTKAGTIVVAYADITAGEAKAMLQTDANTILLDVRTPNEFSSEHIRGARCVPLSALKAHVSALDRSKGIVVYSDSGVESEKARRILAENGFRRVYNLHGGIEAWKAKGFEVSGLEDAELRRDVKHTDFMNRHSYRAKPPENPTAPSKQTNVSNDFETSSIHPMHVINLYANPIKTTLQPNEEYSINVYYYVSHGDDYFFKFWYRPKEGGDWIEIHHCALSLPSAGWRNFEVSHIKAPEKKGNYTVRVAGMQDTWCSPTDYNVADDFDIYVGQAFSI